MSSFERKVQVLVSIYTVFLTMACPLLCIIFFKCLQAYEAVAATVILFIFCGSVFLICHGIIKMNQPNNISNLKSDASADADHIARKILVENLYKQLKNQKVKSHE